MKNIWTNGCFDIVHIGHIELFKYARSLGTKLFVGIDSDHRVKQLKGNSRPFNNEKNRKILLESVRYIDKVYIFDNEKELLGLIKNNNIDTIVVGDDYRNKNIIGSEEAGSVIFFPKIKDISTSLIMRQIDE